MCFRMAREAHIIMALFMPQRDCLFLKGMLITPVLPVLKFLVTRIFVRILNFLHSTLLTKSHFRLAQPVKLPIQKMVQNLCRTISTSKNNIRGSSFQRKPAYQALVFCYLEDIDWLGFILSSKIFAIRRQAVTQS